MSHRMPLAIALIALVAVGTGCGNMLTDSSRVATSEMHLEMNVSEAGGGTSVEARLRKGGPDSKKFVGLDSGDELYFIVNGEEKRAGLPTEMTAAEAAYRAGFEADGSDLTVGVELRRTEHASASISELSMPKPFTMELTSGASRPSRADDAIGIEISNTTDSASTRAEVRGLCFVQEAYTKTFDGTSLTFPAGSFEAESSGEECTTDINIHRARTPSVDSKFGGSSITLERIRYETVTSVP